MRVRVERHARLSDDEARGALTTGRGEHRVALFLVLRLFGVGGPRLAWKTAAMHQTIPYGSHGVVPPEVFPTDGTLRSCVLHP